MPMAALRPSPRRIAGIEVPRDPVSEATWRRAQHGLPEYLLTHSVRAYCWGATIAAAEGWAFDRRVLWTAALLHDLGLTTLRENDDCFEVTGGTYARRFLERAGLPPDDAERVDRAIVLHMRPGVTLADGIESVLLDRATGLDVRGAEFELVAGVRDAVVGAYPRGAFDRHFLAAIRREAAARPTCQSARLLHATGLADWMARSPWASAAGEGTPGR
jgi:HD domain